MSLMLEEIRQQPDVLQRMLENRPTALEALRKRFAREPPSLIVIAARGTSDHAAQFARYLFEVDLRIPTSLAAPSVQTLYGSMPLSKDILVVGISQSGESTDINEYVNAARKQGAFTVGVTNDGRSHLAQCAHETLLIEAGKERSVAATKTYSAELMMIYLLAQALGATKTEASLRRIPELVAQLLREDHEAQRLADRFQDMEHAIVLGRGLNYCNAHELALKLMETSYVVATPYSGADFAHGPIAQVGKGFPVFVFLPPGPTHAQTSKMIERLRSVGADLIGIGRPTEVRALPTAHRLTVRGRIPKTPERPADWMTPIPFIVPAQLFAAFLADRKGLNPDKPRLLSKITQTL